MATIKKRVSKEVEVVTLNPLFKASRSRSVSSLSFFQEDPSENAEFTWEEFSKTNKDAELLFKDEEGKTRLEAGTAEKLIEMITLPNGTDSEFESDLLLTYRVFIPTNDFWNLLMSRFGSKSTNIKKRVLFVVYRWLDMHPYDFVENGELGDQLGQLVDNLLQSVDYLKIVVEISELLHRKKSTPLDIASPFKQTGRPSSPWNGLPVLGSSLTHSTSFSVSPTPSPPQSPVLGRRHLSFSSSTNTFANEFANTLNTPTTPESSFSPSSSPPSTPTLSPSMSSPILPVSPPVPMSPPTTPPFSPLSMTALKNPLLEMQPEELARQITLIEHRLLGAIQPCELLDQVWNDKHKRERVAPSVIAFINRFNQMSHWVATEIVSAPTLDIRTALITRFIHVGKFCRDMHNFNAVMEIVSGLESASVKRLKQTWTALPFKSYKIFLELIDLMSLDGNFKKFRETLDKTDPPAVPYLGVFLSDLTFISDGNPDTVTVDDKCLINFAKHKMTANVIKKIQKYQKGPYNICTVDFIQEYLLNCEILDSKALYAKSLECEPKGDLTGHAKTLNNVKKKSFLRERSNSLVTAINLKFS